MGISRVEVIAEIERRFADDPRGLGPAPDRYTIVLWLELLGCAAKSCAHSGQDTFILEAKVWEEFAELWLVCIPHQQAPKVESLACLASYLGFPEHELIRDHPDRQHKIQLLQL